MFVYFQLFGGTGYPFGDKRSNKTYLMLPYSCPRKIKPLHTRGSDKPEPLYGQAIMIRDNYLYVIGGTTGHLFTCDIYRYEMNSSDFFTFFNVKHFKYVYRM